MAKRVNKKARRIQAVLGVLVLLILAFLAAAPKLNLPFDLPAWNELFRKTPVSYSEAEQRALSVHFLDVGQGDSILIKSGGKAMLIDAGEKENAGHIAAYLKEHGVSKLDTVIVTHPHADHIGGMAQVLEQIPAEQVIMPKVPKQLTPTTSVYRNLLAAISKSGAKAAWAKPGQEFTMGEAIVKVLGPVKAYDDLNNNSIILRLTYGSTSFLFTGDEEGKAEKDLLKSGATVRSTVLKCGHHGSHTSTSSEFLAAVTPEWAVISCGEGNDYGHPHSQTTQRLKKEGVNVLRTDQNGTVILGSDGKTISIATEKGNV